METRHEINETLKDVVNHAAKSRTSLAQARTDLDALIKTTVAELTAERRPTITVRGISTDEGRSITISLPAFRFPTLTSYAVTQGLEGVISLTDLGGPDSPTTIGTAVYTQGIPLVETARYPDLSLESVAMELTRMRLGLCGTGIEG